MNVMTMPLRMKPMHRRKKITLCDEFCAAAWICVFEDIMAFCRSQSCGANPTKGANATKVRK